MPASFWVGVSPATAVGIRATSASSRALVYVGRFSELMQLVNEPTSSSTGDTCVTTTENVELALLLSASVAVHVTVVVAIGKVLPDAGEHMTLATDVPMSDAVGVE